MIVCAQSEFAAFLGLALGLCGGGLGRQGHKDTRTLRINQDLYCVMWTSGDTIPIRQKILTSHVQARFAWVG